MKEIIKNLGHFKAADEHGTIFEIHETSLLRPYAYNSPAPREIERRYAFADGTLVQRISFSQFKHGDAILTRL